jgi:hypothetical protein
MYVCMGWVSMKEKGTRALLEMLNTDLHHAVVASHLCSLAVVSVFRVWLTLYSSCASGN